MSEWGYIKNKKFVEVAQYIDYMINEHHTKNFPLQHDAFEWARTQMKQPEHCKEFIYRGARIYLLK
jgi:hypothetical protein